MDLIYFDNAATSWPKPDVMIKAMLDFNKNIGANPGRSGHRLSIEAARILFYVRESMASLINADEPDTIIFTRNATEGINIILHGLLKPGDHVITSSMEHNSVMRPLHALEAKGIGLTVVPCSPEGFIDPEDVSIAIRKNTKLIITTHASNVTGTILPVSDLAKIARKNEIVYCVDAAQTAGSLPIDVIKDQIDIMVFTGHKSLYGPQGTGGLYIRQGLETMIEPLEQGGTGSRSESEEHPDFMPDRFESGTPNTIGIAGLGAGVGFVLDKGVEQIRNKEVAITGLFLDGLSSIKGVKVYGGMDPYKRTAVVSFTMENIMPSEVSYILDKEYNIFSRPGLQCAPSAHRTIGSFPEGTVRFSFGIFTTGDEIKTAIHAIENIAHDGLKKSFGRR